jgi:diguanylate cyclase (GGDEF)-like protein
MLKTNLDSAQRTGHPLCFAMIDIDHFKKVNDSYGHPVGDQVIIAIARALRQRLRTSDIVGRYGGEEFAVILPNTSRESARLILDMLREDFSRVEFRSDERIFHCSFSCGIANSLDYPTFQALREAADRTLYQAKAAGRNQVLVAAPERSRKEGTDGR